MRHLVCNCTGVTRHDIEILFPVGPRTAREAIESLRTFPFTGTFGKSFQYSNQMVATGGYLAAQAAGGGIGDLYVDYLAQMRRRVFDPIGMGGTTFSFVTARTNPNHATPHGRTADLQLIPISSSLELPLQALAPAGGAWSTVEDLARYLITQLNQGVAPNGRRMVSAKNLTMTWQPQVQITPTASYGLGWAITTYKGARLLNHGGGTSGFSSDLTFLPEAHLGIAILTNAQETTVFNQAARARVLELVYGQPMEIDPVLAQRAAQAQHAVMDQLARLQPLDLDSVAPYGGIYASPGLGSVTLALKGDKFVLDAGRFTTELRSFDKATYVVWDPPLIGLLVKLDRDSTGQRTWELISEDPDESGTWTFTPVH